MGCPENDVVQVSPVQSSPGRGTIRGGGVIAVARACRCAPGGVGARGLAARQGKDRGEKGRRGWARRHAATKFRSRRGESDHSLTLSLIDIGTLFALMHERPTQTVPLHISVRVRPVHWILVWRSLERCRSKTPAADGGDLDGMAASDGTGRRDRCGDDRSVARCPVWPHFRRFALVSKVTEADELIAVGIEEVVHARHATEPSWAGIGEAFPLAGRVSDSRRGGPPPERAR